MHSSLTHLLILFLLVDLLFFALDRGFFGLLSLRFLSSFLQLYSCRNSLEKMFFTMVCQNTIRQKSQTSSCPLVNMSMSTSLLARGQESAPPLSSLNKSSKSNRPPLMFFPMNASLKSSDVFLAAKKKVHVLLSQNVGLCF